MFFQKNNLRAVLGINVLEKDLQETSWEALSVIFITTKAVALDLPLRPECFFHGDNDQWV